MVIFRENSLEIDRLIRPAFLTFFKQRSSFALSTTICSRNEPMVKPLMSWLVPSFSQHNLHLVVSGHCLHVSVTKFQDKFAEMNFIIMLYRHVSHKICIKFCGILRAFVNIADLPEFHSFATKRNITSPELRHLHYQNWRLKICIWWLYFSSCSPQANLRIFSISSPACLVTLVCVAGKISSLFAVVFRCRGRKKLGAFSKSNWNPACLNCSFPASPSLFAGFWWNPTITKCHGTKKIVGYRLYSGVFAIAKQSRPRGSLGRRKGRAWRNALMKPIQPHSSFKIFSRIVWAWCWKSAILSTASANPSTWRHLTPEWYHRMAAWKAWL